MSANSTKIDTGVTRREFVRTAAATGLMMTVPWVHAQESTPSVADLRVALLGPGSQGMELLRFCLKIPNVRFVAVCDIWEFSQDYAKNTLKKYDMPVNVYEDYNEMLAKEKDVDAVIVATPDWVHAEHAIACMKAGKHVYCEKEMSNTLESAAAMVRAARETGKLLQIGHQRRSQPRYWHALKMIEKDKILGRVTHVYGQWNRARMLEVGWPKGREMSADKLKRYGYASMEEFRNWRWYRKFSGGPIADLGSHQIDIFNWFLKTPPAGVLASGGLDYYTEQAGRDWYDNIATIYEYKTETGPVRGLYEVFNTTSHGGFYEQFMGDEGSMVISDDGKTGQVFREVQAKPREWEDEAEKVEKMGREAIDLKIGETLTPEGKKDPEGEKLALEAQKDSRQLHLENFFNAVRGEVALTCPAEIAYETAVTVLRANDAVASGCRHEFKPNEFKV